MYQFTWGTFKQINSIQWISIFKMSPFPFSSAPLELGIFGETVTSASVFPQFTGFLFSCSLVSRLCILEAGSRKRVEWPRVLLSKVTMEFIIVTSLSLIINIAVLFYRYYDFTAVFFFLVILFFCVHTQCRAYCPPDMGVENHQPVLGKVPSIFQAPRPAQCETVNELSLLC